MVHFEVIDSTNLNELESIASSNPLSCLLCRYELEPSNGAS